MTAFSYAAVIVGFVGTWIAGRHRTGWLIGATSATMCLIVNAAWHLWAFVAASIVAAALAVRNWAISPRKET